MAKIDKTGNNDLASQLMSDINKDLEDEVAVLVDDGSPSDVKVFIPTGSTLLDYVISNQIDGGIPVGKVAEIAGLEGTGKTLLAMQICANAQKMGGLPVYIDTEHAFNTDFAQRVGLDTKNNFIYVNPGTVEDVFKTIFTIIHRLDEQEKKVKEKIPFVVIVWDSVAATPTKQDVEGENPDPAATIGLKPRILSKNIYTLLGMTGRKRVAQVFLNQLRTNIKAQPFQDPYITPGGKAIPFAASVRLRISTKGKIKVDDSIVGIEAQVKCVKTRFGPPYRSCEFPIYFTHGVDDTESIVDMLVEKDVIIGKSAGAKGKVFYLKGDSADTAVSKVELKRKYKNDPAFKKLINHELSKVMVKDMVNPDTAELEIVQEDEE
jgi:recombination protein RecA